MRATKQIALDFKLASFDLVNDVFLTKTKGLARRKDRLNGQQKTTLASKKRRRQNVKAGRRG